MRNEVTGIIGKIMLKTEGTMVKQLSKKIWEEMVKHGGIALLICQMSALANKVAYKAHEKAGQLLEKEVRINTLIGVSEPIESVIIDMPEETISETICDETEDDI